MLCRLCNVRCSSLILAFTIVVAFAPVPFFAQTETVLHAFSGADGANQGLANLTIDSKGNLYGTTPSGGAHGYGTVYRIPAGGGENLLYSFTGKADGGNPQAGVVVQNGALYGTAQFGGMKGSECTALGCGTVFKVTGIGKESVIHTFAGASGDGAFPYGSLIADKSGNLYGTTAQGGSLNVGTIFELTASGTEQVLYSFANPPDGSLPTGTLVRDSHGNIYGTTNSGGVSCATQGCGTAFELAATGESILHEFNASPNDGVYPWGGLVADSKGLYGTASGGKYGAGIVFKLSQSAGTWKETILYEFTGLADGAAPNGSLLLDGSGNLYGTATGGGAFQAGVVYRISPTGQETVLYSFTGGADGRGPLSGLVADKQGNLYGTTSAGGNVNSKCTGGFGAGCGVVFKLTP